ncbi:Ig-like domain-containing protein, partial [Pontiellaceae bacterium B12219]|nr:Ig-like domain-containing protein [Pontiellaceae bacterium B12219]
PTREAKKPLLLGFLSKNTPANKAHALNGTSSNYNFLAEFAWRAEGLPWLKKWSVFEWGISGGDPDTTDASSADPADMNSPRLSLHYSNDASDPGWEDLAECGLLLAGWDGNTNIVDETAYIIHNKGRFLRLIDHPASNSVTHATVLNRTATEQFQFETAPNGKKYIVGLSDGRRLSCDGSSVGLAAAGTTGSTVEWEFNEYQYGWFYIDHPSTGKRLRISDANVIDVTNDSDTYDNVRFRFIKHYLPIRLTEVQALPYVESFENGIGDWREFDNASARFWEVGSGGTPTAGAGPSGASDGDFYLFSEGHDAGSYITNSAECVFDFSTVADVELLFDYHMYGSYIAFLSLDVFDGTTWTSNVWKKTGQQHSGSDQAWTTAAVDLTSYAGNSEVTLRFRTANKQWNAADPAIDHIRIANSAYNYAPVANAQSVAATSGSSVAITLSGSDVDGDSLSYSFSQPANGSLTGTAPNLTYTPANGYAGSDSFTFSVNDGALDSAPATVSIAVDPAVDPGQVIFSATTANSTFVNNVVQGNPATGSLTDIGSDLVVTNHGVNFGMVGFASTSDINTLNGTALTAADTVILKVAVEDLDGTIRANGVNFGMSSDVNFVVPTESGTSLLIGAEAANNGSDILIAGSFQDSGNTGFKASDAELYNGFTMTLTADVTGYTFVLDSVGAADPVTVSGTFAGSEFLDYFSTGHFYYAAQQFNTGSPLVSTISEASISIVKGGEEAEVPSFVAGGTYVSNGNLIVGFTGSVGYEYSIESTDGLSDTNSWTVATNIAAMPASPMEVVFPATNRAAFYRAVVE